MKLFLFFILTILAMNVQAMTITSIKYEGMVHISEPVALRMLEFEVGDEVDEQTLDQALKAYYKQGYFKDAWVDFENGILTFNLDRKSVV